MMVHNIKLPKSVENIPGWLTFEEACCLQAAVWFASGLPGDLAEIGSYCGRSTVVIGSALAQGCCGHLYAIDPHEGNYELYGIDSLNVFKEEMYQHMLSKYVTLCMNKAEDICTTWGKPLKFLFIDGNHEYEAVSQDFKLWSNHIVRNGFILFHDSYEYGPAKVINDIQDSKCDEYQLIAQAGSITVFKKLVNR